MSKPDIFEINRNRDQGIRYISLVAGDDQDGIFYYEKENAIAVMALFEPAPGWNEAMGNAVEELMEAGYPAGTLMSFFQFGIPDIGETIRHYKVGRIGTVGDESVTLAKLAVENRADYLETGTKRRLLRSSTAKILHPLCVWTLKIPVKTKKPLDGSEEDHRKFLKECEEFKRLYGHCLTQLKTAGFNLSVAGRSQAMAVLRRIFDMDGKWDDGIDEELPLNMQLFPPGSTVDWNVFRNGMLMFKGFSHERKNQNVGILTVDRYPNEENRWHMSRMIDLLGHPGGSGPQPGMPYILQTSIHFPNQDKKKNQSRCGSGCNRTCRPSSGCIEVFSASAPPSGRFPHDTGRADKRRSACRSMYHFFFIQPFAARITRRTGQNGLLFPQQWIRDAAGAAVACGQLFQFTADECFARKY